MGLLGTRAGWRGANPEARESKRARTKILDLAIVMDIRLVNEIPKEKLPKKNCVINHKLTERSR